MNKKYYYNLSIGDFLYQLFRTKKYNNFIIIIFFIILSLLSSVILFKTHTLFGPWDLNFHIRRVIELEESLSKGHFLPPLFSFNASQGSAMMAFYPSINLLPIAFFHFIIKSNITLFYLFIDSNIFLSFLSCYFGSLGISKSKKVSLIFSIIYSMGFPLLCNSFYNFDLGSLTALSILPLTCFGFINILNKRGCLEFVFGSTIILYSHVLSFVIVGVFIFILFIINFNKIDKIIGKLLIKSILLISLLTSVIWIPAFYIVISNWNNIHAPSLNPLVGTSFTTLIYSSYKGYTVSYLSLFALIGLLLSVIFYHKFNIYQKQSFWISIAFIILCSNIFPWGITNYGVFKILRIFQFTYRFYIIPELLLSYIFAVCIVRYINHKYIKILIISFTLLLVFSCQFEGQTKYIHNNFPSVTRSYVKNHVSHKNGIRGVEFYDTKPKGINSISNPSYKVSSNKELNRVANLSSTLTINDYFPDTSLPRINYINNNEATYGHNRTINVKHTGYNQFSFDSPKRINRLALPLLHYNSEHLRVYVNHHLVHSHANGNSLVTLDNVKKGRSVVGVRSVPNVWIVVMKSVLFVIGMVWLIWIYFKYSFLDKFERNEVDLYIKKFIKDYRRVIVLDTFLITIFIILSIKPLPHIDDYLMGIIASFTVTGFLYTYHCGRKISKHRPNIRKIHKKHKYEYYSAINDLKGHISNFDYQFGKALTYANKLSQLPRNASSSIIFKYICGINTILSNATQEYRLYMKQDIGEIQWNLLYVHRFRNEFRGRMDRYSELIKKNCNNIFSDLDKIPSYSYMLKYMTFSQKKRKNVCKNIETQLSNNMHVLSKTCVNEISMMK